jgi:predicted MPP superfamily phosphohydrolase
MYPVHTGPLTLERVTVPIAGLPEHLQGVRLVQLTDLHFDGKRLSPELLEAAIVLVNRLKPDLVALTGDFVTKDAAPIFKLSGYLQQIQTRYGVVAVLGNHDNVTLGGRQTILRELKRSGIVPLWNAIAFPFGPALPVVGLADKWSRDFWPGKVLNQIPQSVPRLVLSHNPDSAMVLARWRVDLQLSGHTHGGQIVIPGLGPLARWNPRIAFRKLMGKAVPLPFFNSKCSRVVRHWEWASGLHQVGENWLYVNRGLGTYAPGRFRCPPEVTEITLVKDVNKS